MKIVSDYFSSIEGIAIFPIISIIIFFVFFIAVGIHVLRMDKDYVKELSNYPIDEQ